MAPNGRAGFEALDNCVHCGFCLPACPTYLATADENDSPRGRIHLIRAVERGELASSDPGVVQHLDACLGCRGCEPACPSGVEYGRGLAAMRARLTGEHGLPWRARLVLGVFARPWAWRAAFAIGRWLRAAGLLAPFAGGSRAGFLAGMLEATRPASPGPLAVTSSSSPPPPAFPPSRPSAALFRGCVMSGLFDHVHQATRRTLEANGFRVIEVDGQVCCGALHEHAGDRATALRLAATNLAAFRGQADFVAVNSAGCGAFLKDVGHLVGGDAAKAFADSVKDVSELLATAGPRSGAPLPLQVCYDAPCHLQHAQRIQEEPLRLLQAIPDLQLRVLPGSDRCCGSAGIYGVLHPALSRAVLDAKVTTIVEATPQPRFVATGNPGCLMQIGAGLRAAGLATRAIHPVELLDWSYQRAGVYGGAAGQRGGGAAGQRGSEAAGQRGGRGR
jgi:glycolate oxidase iron-sulfur subunit